MAEASIETDADRAEVLRLLRQDVLELHAKVEHLRNELLGALNEKDEMQRALDLVASQATKWRSVEAMVFAISEKTG